MKEKAVKEYFMRGRETVESLFPDTCFLEEYTAAEKPWGETVHLLKRTETGFPCRLIQRTKSAVPEGLLREAKQEIRLLYPADRHIPAGSAVLIRRENGEECRFTAAGESLIFFTHKETGLKQKKIL